MGLEEKVKGIFNDVLDIGPEEIKSTETFAKSLGMDSTEMVEINVAIKKAFGLDMENNAIKKDMTFNQLIEFLKSKGVTVK